MARLIWTQDEVKILKANYEFTPQAELQKLLPRFPIEKIRLKASRLGLKRKIKEPRKNIKHNRWTPEEVEKLKQIYSISTNEELIEEFQRFDLRGIRSKARSLDLEKDAHIAKMDKQQRMQKTLGEDAWDSEEEQILIDNYSSMGQNGVHRLLPHKTIGSIRSKVFRLGLKKEQQVIWEQTNMSVSKGDVFSIQVIYERMDV